MLADGRSVPADDNYIRESILNPQAKIVKGFATPSIMPTFQGQVNEDDLIKLLAYVKSLGAQKQPVVPVESPSSFQSNSGSPYSPGAGIPPQPQPATQTTKGQQP